LYYDWLLVTLLFPLCLVIGCSLHSYYCWWFVAKYYFPIVCYLLLVIFLLLM